MSSNHHTFFDRLPNGHLRYQQPDHAQIIASATNGFSNGDAHICDTFLTASLPHIVHPDHKQDALSIVKLYPKGLPWNHLEQVGTAVYYVSAADKDARNILIKPARSVDVISGDWLKMNAFLDCGDGRGLAFEGYHVVRVNQVASDLWQSPVISHDAAFGSRPDGIHRESLRSSMRLFDDSESRKELRRGLREGKTIASLQIEVLRIPAGYMYPKPQAAAQRR